MRIVVADHNTQVSYALRKLLEELPQFELIGEVADATTLIALAKAESPDLILVDSDLPGMYIEDLITQLHTNDPVPIVVAMSCEFDNSRKMLKAGADAFVSKGDKPEWLLETLYQFESRPRKTDS
jgi:DNA-binding NarL/FixJ family response regulator